MISSQTNLRLFQPTHRTGTHPKHATLTFTGYNKPGFRIHNWRGNPGDCRTGGFFDTQNDIPRSLRVVTLRTKAGVNKNPPICRFATGQNQRSRDGSVQI